MIGIEDSASCSRFSCVFFYSNSGVLSFKVHELRSAVKSLRITLLLLFLQPLDLVMEES